MEDFGLEPLSPDAGAESLNACHICIRDDAHHGWNFYKDRRGKGAGPADANVDKRRRVALAFPATSKGVKEFWDLALLSVLLPSLARTVDEADVVGHCVTLYIGFDEGDPIYDERASLKRLAQKIRKVFEGVGIAAVAINFLRVGISGAVTFIWNSLFAMAMHDGQEYFYQLNDDVRFLSHGWLRTLTQALRERNDFGVVGPNDSAFQCRILTQSMVGRPHWHAFGWYFPPDFRNWHCDTWISLVYAHWTQCFPKMQIFNGRYGKNGQLPRYQACRQVQFRPLTLHYQAQRLKNATGHIDPQPFYRRIGGNGLTAGSH